MLSPANHCNRNQNERASSAFPWMQFSTSWLHRIQNTVQRQQIMYTCIHAVISKEPEVIQGAFVQLNYLAMAGLLTLQHTNAHYSISGDTGHVSLLHHKCVIVYILKCIVNSCFISMHGSCGSFHKSPLFVPDQLGNQHRLL